jgi:hypothetical protein
LPPDGYWRARPLPPPHMRWTAHGSSFLIGPIEDEGRPLVDIRDVSFDAETRSFRLSFARGGGATMRLRTLVIARESRRSSNHGTRWWIYRNPNFFISSARAPANG